jgi:hypothetical protein
MKLCFTLSTKQEAVPPGEGGCHTTSLDVPGPARQLPGPALDFPAQPKTSGPATGGPGPGLGAPGPRPGRSGPGPGLPGPGRETEFLAARCCLARGFRD